MNSNQQSGLGLVLRVFLIVDLILSALVATRTSLLIAVGGDFIGAGAGVTGTATVGTWLATFVMWAIVQGFIMAVGTIVCGVVFGALFKGVFFSENGGLTPLAKLEAKIAVVVAVLGSALGAFFQYGVLASSAVHADGTLNLLSSILTFVVGSLYGTVVVGFILAVATVIVGVLYAVFSGGGRSNGAK